MNKSKRTRVSKFHDQIVELAPTKSLSDIGRELGIPHTSLSGYLKKHNIKAFSDRQDFKELTPQIKQLVEKRLTVPQIAKELNCDVCSLRYQIKINALQVRPGAFILDDEDCKKVQELYLSGLQGSAIAEEMNIGVGVVYGALKRTNTTMRDSYENKFLRGITINKDAFSDFNSDEAAVYWYGWLLTDGHVSDKYIISMGLKEEDSYVLHALKDYMGSNAGCKPITYFHKQLQRDVTAVNFSVSDKVLSSRLKAQGMEPRKSCKEKVPLFYSHEFKFADIFWRACVEGDGYVSKNLKKPVVDIVGSEELLTTFREYCEKYCGVKVGKKLTARSFGDPNFRKIAYSGTDALKIMQKLWARGSFFLKRKQAIVHSQLASRNMLVSSEDQT